MLVDDGFFAAGSLSTQLDRAYEDFQSFCRLKKIYCSQPPFKPGLDTCLINSNLYYLEVFECACGIDNLINIAISLSDKNRMMSTADLFMDGVDFRWASTEVVKKTGDIMMTCKAFNGRVVTEWLNDVLSKNHHSSNDVRMGCAYICVKLVWHS